MNWMQEFNRGGLERSESPDPGDPAYIDMLADQMAQERLDDVPRGVVVHWHDPTNMGGTIVPPPMDPLEVTRAGAHQEIEIQLRYREQSVDPYGFGVLSPSKLDPPHKVIIRTRSGHEIVTWAHAVVVSHDR